jgi:flagellum-specific peptidoglycan hydrolase FlgJ
MITRILFCFIVVLLVGCGTSKSKVRTQKKSSNSRNVTQSKPKPEPTPKPVVKETRKETETLTATSNVAVSTDVVAEYIKQYKEVAQNNMRQYGIPASITLAQGILESGAGNGKLSQLANNHFGIKCHKEWTGPSVRHDDDAAQECFRKYEHPQESYRDHSLFLTSRSRYNSLFKLPKNDYVSWAKGLKAAGYATDPKYPDKLIGLIERYQLHLYDAEVLNQKPFQSVSKSNQTQSESVNQTTAASSGRLTHTVSSKETLYGISVKYKTTVEELKKLNNLKDNNLSIGQILIIK